MFEKLARTLAGVLVALVGLAIIGADVIVSYRTGNPVHLVNMCVGGGLAFAGGFIISPADVAAMLKLCAPYVPFMRHDGGPPGGPTGGVP